MRKVLVTGASGFVGGHVVHALQSRGLAVRCLVRPTSRLDFIASLAPELALGDVTEPETLHPALDGVDGVVHCAGITKSSSRTGYFRVNEDGPRNLYAACKARAGNFTSIVHVSSLAALGPSRDGTPVTEDCVPHPVSDYGESKLAGQRVAESFVGYLPLSIVVPPAVYGPRDADFYVYFKFVARGFVPLIGAGTHHISLVYVKDLAAAIVEVLVSNLGAGRSYLVDDGSIHTWSSVADTIARAMEKTPRRIYMPAIAAKGAGLIGDLCSKITGKASIVSSQKVREFLQASWTCSSRRLCDELGFRPQYILARGIEETLCWYREKEWL